ncbi:MAG TPA: glycosyltransferase family 9 protein, partial [Chthoniobacterales bacterium]|nr:glycosyltransferase family 9 protein [Chthoniobacterales bacterium]
VVAIFGSTEPRLTGPLGDAYRILRHQVECSPCFLRECPIDFRCMKAVTVAEVVESVSSLLHSWEEPHDRTHPAPSSNQAFTDAST